MRLYASMRVFVCACVYQRVYDFYNKEFMKRLAKFSWTFLENENYAFFHLLFVPITHTHAHPHKKYLGKHVLKSFILF